MYSRVLRLVSGLLILCALGGVALAVLSLLNGGNGDCHDCGIASRHTAGARAHGPWPTTGNFPRQPRATKKAHLANIVDSNQVLVYCVLAAIPILLLLTILDNFLV